MKKTMIAFGIIFMFLLMGVISVSSVEVKKFESTSKISTFGINIDLAGLLITHTPVFGEFYYNIAAGIYNFEGTANIKDMKIIVEIFDQYNEIIEEDSYTFKGDIILGPNDDVIHNFLFPFSYMDYRIRVTLDFSNRPDLYNLDSNPDNNYVELPFPKSIEKQMSITPLFYFIQKTFHLLFLLR
jgi:hypothetical protein